MKLAFIGLGVMGYPMAGHLANAGHRVTVYNRSSTKAQRWLQAYSGQQAATPALAAQEAEMVFACVGNDDDVRQIALGADGAFNTIARGGVFIDHTTTSATLARELQQEASRRGFQFVDAPVSGGQAGAERGSLSVMVGSEESVFDQVKPVIDLYAKTSKRMGPVGSGQLTKMVNQICLAGIIQSLSEGLFFAEQVGLDPATVIEVISQGAAQSWQMDNRASTMIERQFDFGFAVDWMRKDLKIVQDQLRELNLQLPVADLVDQFYAQVQAMGGKRWDTSSLIKVLDANSGAA